ncbi:hypothetical protein ASF56_24775 [Methylobacterium sp. Leaf122]|nr:hypothetical protein ASF56_24775 [Methylobacterium sp. Leaf122]
MPGDGWKLIKQIIGKLKDWAPLSVIALYLLAVPVSYALGDPVIAFGMALILSVILVVLRGFQMSLESRTLTKRIDADRELKLQKARNDLQVKLAKLNKPGIAPPALVPSIGAPVKAGKANAGSKRSSTGTQPKTAGGN